MKVIARLGDWLEDRAGLKSFVRLLLHERIPGGASWTYVFGSVLAFVFVLQATTGVMLAMHFSASATDAWGSVYYIQNEMTWGWMIRGLHHFGSSAMVILVALHMVQVFLFGAYKAPRELNWISGVLLLGLVLGFSLTGYLLPWDQKGYWATKVATSITGGMPGLGETVQRLLQGGDEYGNFTLTRFFALHVFVLPGGLLALLCVHVVLMRRHGVTPRPGRSPEELERTAGWFWPTQVLIDIVAMALVLAVLMSLAIWVGAPLDAPADPNADAYPARPEWYFLFLFQLLKYFEGPLMLVGTAVIPGLATVFLLLLPFLDRGPDRRLRARKVWAVLFFGGIAAVGALTVAALRRDAGDPAFQAQRVAASRDAAEAIVYARTGGIDAHGRIVLYQGRKVFRRERCDECPTALGGGAAKAPHLDGYLSRAWLERFLRDPDAPEHFGNTDLAGMMAPVGDLPAATLAALVEYLASRSGEEYDPPIDAALVARGRAAFESDTPGCRGCHEPDAESERAAPDLSDLGSRPWLRRLLHAPSAPRAFGSGGAGMPAFDHLGDAEADYLVTWLLNLKRESTPQKATPAPVTP